MPQLLLRAPAKLNLFLHILGRRTDGYHMVESLVVFCDIADELVIEESDALSLTVTGEFADTAGAAADNMVMQAAYILKSHSGFPCGARMRLTKNIPVGAGLGGGSADAAAAMQGLNRLWQLGMNHEELGALAVNLGADVAMCLVSKPLLARGIGEEITLIRHALPAIYAVLVHPRVTLLTAEVYTEFRAAETNAQPAWRTFPAGDAEFWRRLGAARNHLQRAAITINPLVAEIMLALETLRPPAQLVRMTGSGACCYALYTAPDAARIAAACLAAAHPDWWVRNTVIELSDISGNN